ncbi:hypothetical protein NP013_24020, partial [Salmonella enterica]|nr:hypothetical protein [Salmonella enterica]
SLKTSIKTITYLSDIGCLEIQGASLLNHLKSLFLPSRRRPIRLRKICFARALRVDFVTLS